MAELTAVEKRSCAACGAQAEWNPGRQALVCAHCGTIAPGTLDLATGKVREIDLAQALRELPEDARGFGADKRSVRCRSCQAVSVFDPQRVAQRCDFCGSSEIVAYEELRSPIRPEGVLPFKLDAAAVRDALRGWFKRQWLAPGSFKRGALVDALQGVYLPYWTFDARVRCAWTAESGTYYYTTETVRDAQGRRHTRQVRHVRWSPAAGEIEHTFDDEAVPGTRGVDARLLRGIEPFPTRDVLPYDTAFIAGFVVEHYQVVLVEAAQRAREAMDEELTRRCGAQVPGDTFRHLRIEPQYAAQTFKHLLVPVWLSVYRFGSTSYQVLVNGVTGALAGRSPKSPWKIAALVLAGIVVAVALALLAR